MEEFSDLSEIQARLLNVKQTICIEGFCGSGKSHLASAISIRPARCVIRLDSFVREREAESNFSDLIDMVRLNRALSSVPEGAIFEGILARQFLPKESAASMLMIYVKSISASTGIWHDAPDPQSDAVRWLHKVDLDYHLRFQPHLRADIVYLRRE